MNILYVHGFNSSENSATLKRIRELFKTEEDAIIVHATTLPYMPNEAIAYLRSYIDNSNIVFDVVIGSSLGGLYANLISIEYDIACIMLHSPCNAEFFKYLEGSVVHRYNNDDMTINNNTIELDFYVSEVFIIEVDILIESIYDNPYITNPKCFVLLNTKDDIVPFESTYNFYVNHDYKVVIYENDDEKPHVFSNMNLLKELIDNIIENNFFRRDESLNIL